MKESEKAWLEYCEKFSKTYRIPVEEVMKQKLPLEVKAYYEELYKKEDEENGEGT